MTKETGLIISLKDGIAEIVGCEGALCQTNGSWLSNIEASLLMRTPIETRTIGRTLQSIFQIWNIPSMLFRCNTLSFPAHRLEVRPDFESLVSRKEHIRLHNRLILIYVLLLLFVLFTEHPEERSVSVKNTTFNKLFFTFKTIP